MAKAERGDEIVSGVRYGGRVFVPGDEDALIEAALPHSTLNRLAELGVIRGFGTKVVQPSEVTMDDDEDSEDETEDSEDETEE